LLKELGIQDKFVVLFAGNIGRVQGIQLIIETVTLLQEYPQICFLFIGSGALEALLRQEMERRNLRNILVLPNQPRESQNLFLNACDITMLSLSQNMLGMGVPSRLYNYMAAGKPVIGVVEIESEPGRVIDEEEIGWVVPPGDPVLLADVILQASRSDLLAEMGNRARNAALLHYSQKRIVSMYAKLADSLDLIH
jgi:glycosyltransferase involved in cell wall biosynthesis